MTEDGGKLVEFPKGPDAVEITIGRWRPREPVKCRHFQVELREDPSLIAGGVVRRRAVACAKCGEELDPFEVLWRYAAGDDKLRREHKARQALEGAWSWLWENGGTLSISRAGGVKSSIEINGKRRWKKANPCVRDGLPSLIINAVEALKMMKKWEQGSCRGE